MKMKQKIKILLYLCILGTLCFSACKSKGLDKARLKEAIKSCDAKAVEQIVKKGNDVNFNYNDDDVNITPLQIACLIPCNSDEIINILLKAGAAPDLKDKYGATALMSAASNGKKEAVKMLLEAGADPNLQDVIGSSLVAAAMHSGVFAGENTEVIDILLKAGAKVNLQGKGGYTALMWASFNGDRETVNVLLKAGAAPNLKDENGDTALSKASKRGHKEIVNILKKAGSK
jgi:serine/threonine-protein phosphatase 6 regulatory ankyrin repeat subunit B